MEKIKYHLDESVERAIAEALRRRSIDVTTTPEANLLGITDEEQLTFAIANNRVIFTQDDDFLALDQRGLPHCGIVYCHQNSRSIGQIVRGLVLIWEVLEPLEMHNHIELFKDAIAPTIAHPIAPTHNAITPATPSPVRSPQFSLIEFWLEWRSRRDWAGVLPNSYGIPEGITQDLESSSLQ